MKKFKSEINPKDYVISSKDISEEFEVDIKFYEFRHKERCKYISSQESALYKKIK